MNSEDSQHSPAGNAQASPSSAEARTPTIQLPKGGGAIHGMGEKFASNPVTGTGSMSVPIATSPGRSGFSPQLSLSYDSGSGNGPFGFGWSHSLPSITRKTSKGLPQYFDAQESDVFVLSGAEDLVPVQKLPVRTVGGVIYQVDRYRPRIEGLFARIERWTNTGDATDVFWRSISKGNITTWYGKTSDSRIVDPSDLSFIFSWMICQSHDDKGNVIAYGYKAEDSARILEDGSGNSLAKANERNRTDTSRSAQRYLKRIRYGNRSPYFPVLKTNAPWPEPLDPPWSNSPGGAIPDGSNTWLFEAVLDYGEHDSNVPMPLDAGIWPARRDPFSSYRSCFEVRTYRTCQRVLMFHHFPGEAGVGRDCLVRSTDFTYSDEVDPTDVRNPVYTFLRSVKQNGYRRENGGYEQSSPPPVEFEYTEPTVQDAVEEVDSQSLENLPIGLDGSVYRWTDLHGEGIPGILTEQAGAWFYKRNLSPIPDRRPNGSEFVRAKFAPLEVVALKPTVALSGGAEFMDLAGDGQPDVVIMDGPMPGLYEHDDAEGWQPFRPFTSRLTRSLGDPNIKFVDLDGDGHADILITENDAFVWHASLAEKGFGPAQRVAQALDEEKGPRIVFADGTQSIYLADLSGDGLTDIVRIRNGEVCYWPNLGYGRFGAKVTMDNAPWFDNPDQFDHKRIRLADIDGSGTTDIIYLHREGVRLYFNQSGNSWGKPHQLRVFPRVDDVVSIVPTDLLGNGTVCLVWSSPLPGDARRPMRYVNLMGGQKPHLLFKTINNLGAETRVDYTPSTKFYLQDKRDGKPWITRLPFPVHVVERVETFDHISRSRFVTRYAYHHGYFDGEEREFRGFGMVEQWDTEQFAAYAGGEMPADNIDAASHVPPVLTRTWFHTGIYLGRDRVSNYYAGLVDGSDRGEYYREPAWLDNGDEAKKRLLLDTVLTLGLTVEEEREACRALKGSMLRQEVYALDGVGVETDNPYGHPYTVAEKNYTVSTLQRRGRNRHAVFFAHAREAITYHYERKPKDPRVQHSMTLEVDAYGNVLKQAAIGYGRLTPATDPAFTPADHLKQRLIHITSTENSFTNAITDKEDDYRTPLPAEARTYELRKPNQEKSSASLALYGFDPVLSYINQASDGVHDVEYEDVEFNRARQAAADNDAENTKYFRRPIEWLRTLYRRDDLTGLLPLGELQPLALPGESYKLAFTPGLIFGVYQRDGVPLIPTPTQVLPVDGVNGLWANRGGYVDLDGNGHWWLPSGRSFFSDDPTTSPQAELAEARQHFFLPRRFRDPFGQDAFVDFDTHDLLMIETRDALSNRVTVDTNDYRVLQPRLVSDPNRNQMEVAFDVLGMVVGTAIMGKPLPAPVEGDSLTGFVTDLTQVQLDAFFGAADPRANAPVLLRDATTRVVYDLDRFRRTQRANPNDSTKWQASCAATLARETHASAPLPPQGLKIQLSVSYSDGFGREIQKKIQAEPGSLDINDPQAPIVNPRWVGSGWTIFNNKGKPVRQYEPFFSATHGFEFGAQVGISPVLFYDPAERVVATLHPNHTYEKVVFDPWQQTTYDVNDTCAARNSQTGDPRTDTDIGGYVAEYFKALPANPAQPWKTWHTQRIGGTEQDERNAALRAEAHADTPTTAHFDALGRPFMTVARNRVVCPGHALDSTEDSFATRIDLDIEGNQRAVLDERRLPVNHLPTGVIEQRIVMRYAYDMLGNRIHQHSMEAGARWMLNDVAGKPVRAWDSRGHCFTTTYDGLRRPVEQTVRGTIANGEAASDPRTLGRDFVVDRIEYAETLANAEALNLRTRIYRHFDSAGVATNAKLDTNGNPTEAYDFKGNLLRSTRRLATLYREIPDWSQNPPPQLDAEFFEGSTRYDALNRSIQSIAPHSNLTRPERPNKINIIQPVFNEANLLERLDVWLERAAEPTSLLNPEDPAAPPSQVGVSNIDYDAKGQRQRIDYKSGVSTSYTHDELTFRLTHLVTRRNAGTFPDDDPQPPVAEWPGKQLQNLHYTYDPAGNITHIQDDAQQAVYFLNQRVEPSNDYNYDALYRLIQASGREHLGQGGAPMPHSYNDAGRTGILSANPPGRFAANDVAAMSTYTERYVYDAVGNFLQMQHERTNAAVAGWTRRYSYGDASLTEPTKFSNRLSTTTVGGQSDEVYAHDAHGNMLRMPQLAEMQWDYKDQLRLTRRQRVNADDLDGNDHHGERTFYVYDAAGQRIRKVCEKALGLTEERIYLGGFEIFRRHGGAIGANAPTLERETLHVMDDKQRIALVETRTLDTAGNDLAPRQLIRYQFGNHLGSASLELDEQAQIISYEEYAPYGCSTYQAVRSLTEAAKRYRHTGKERDEESGLYYYGARYYSSWTGRWTAVDPLLGMNRYLFVLASPCVDVDIGGLASNRQLLGLDDTAVDAALQQDPSLKNVVKLAAKQTLYDVWNGLTAGFVSKHDALFEAREQGAISDTDYWTKTTGEASKSLLVATVSAATGGGAGAGAKTLVAAVVQGGVRGAASGAISGAAADLTEQAADIALGSRSDIDLKQTVKSARSGAITGALFGAAAGGAEKLATPKPQLGDLNRELKYVPGQETRLATPDEALKHKVATTEGAEIVTYKNVGEAPRSEFGGPETAPLPDDLGMVEDIFHTHSKSQTAAFSHEDIVAFDPNKIPAAATLRVSGAYGPTKAALAEGGVHIDIPGANPDSIVTTFMTQGQRNAAVRTDTLRTFFLAP
jgi:RHS repeat-associated protein